MTALIKALTNLYNQFYLIMIDEEAYRDTAEFFAEKFNKRQNDKAKTK